MSDLLREIYSDAIFSPLHEEIKNLREQVDKLYGEIDSLEIDKAILKNNCEVGGQNEQRLMNELVYLKEMNQSVLRCFSECLEFLKICKPDYHPNSPMGAWEKFIKANLTLDVVKMD